MFRAPPDRFFAVGLDALIQLGALFLHAGVNARIEEYQPTEKVSFGDWSVSAFGLSEVVTMTGVEEI